QRLGRRVAEAHVPELDAEMPGTERLRVAGVDDGGRIEQQLGELRRVGQCALEAAIDAVELPDDTCDGRVVAEGDEHRLEAAGRAPAGGQGDDEAHRVRGDVH